MIASQKSAIDSSLETSVKQLQGHGRGTIVLTNGYLKLYLFSKYIFMLFLNFVTFLLFLLHVILFSEHCFHISPRTFVLHTHGT